MMKNHFGERQLRFLLKDAAITTLTVVLNVRHLQQIINMQKRSAENPAKSSPTCRALGDQLSSSFDAYINQ